MPTTVLHVASDSLWGATTVSQPRRPSPLCIERIRWNFTYNSRDS